MAKDPDRAVTGTRKPRTAVSPPSESVPIAPQTTPNSVGYGGSDHSFTLQTVFEMQKSLGELIATVNTLKTSIDSVKSKVDQLSDWKNRILGGAVVLGVIFSLLGFGISKFSEYVVIKAPEKIVPPPTGVEGQQFPSNKIVIPLKK